MTTTKKVSIKKPKATKPKQPKVFAQGYSSNSEISFSTFLEKFKKDIKKLKTKDPILVDPIFMKDLLKIYDSLVSENESLIEERYESCCE